MDYLTVCLITIELYTVRASETLVSFKAIIHIIACITTYNILRDLVVLYKKLIYCICYQIPFYSFSIVYVGQLKSLFLFQALLHYNKKY